MITEQEYISKRERLKAQLLQTDALPPLALRKQTSNLFRFRAQPTGAVRLDVRDFNHIIAIDALSMTADVEGMTTYEELVGETLKHNLMPAVVPELKSITVGGALAGIGIEATSFRYGFVHETVLEFEALLSDGRTIVCRPDNEHSDLFFGFPNSYGTLGYALRCKIKLIPVKRYVQVTHRRYDNAASYFSALQSACSRPDNDFVDGVIFGQNEYYLNEARFVGQTPFTSDYTYLNIYYRSIRAKDADYLNTADYIWRWDTDWFWCSRYFYLERPLLRRLVGKKRLNSKWYMKLRRLAHRHNIPDRFFVGARRRETVIQDVEIPLSRAAEFAEFFQKEIAITPVWVCPVRAYDPQTRFSLYAIDLAGQLYVNFGFWDTVPSSREPGYYNRLIEKKVSELAGKKSLYSDSYYDRETFWTLYNRPVYDALKVKYDPQGRLLNLYDKCVQRR